MKILVEILVVLNRTSRSWLLINPLLLLESALSLIHQAKTQMGIQTVTVTVPTMIRLLKSTHSPISALEGRPLHNLMSQCRYQNPVMIWTMVSWNPILFGLDPLILLLLLQHTMFWVERMGRRSRLKLIH